MKTLKEKKKSGPERRMDWLRSFYMDYINEIISEKVVLKIKEGWSWSII